MDNNITYLEIYQKYFYFFILDRDNLIYHLLCFKIYSIYIEVFRKYIFFN